MTQYKNLIYKVMYKGVEGHTEVKSSSDDGYPRQHYIDYQKW